MLKFYYAINRNIRSDGLCFGLFLFTSKILQRLKSFFYGWLLKAPGIRIGRGSQIYGSRYIKFGNDISIFRDLWLEAVTEYCGNEFIPIIEIGNRVGFSRGVHISAINKIIIGNDVLFGSHVFISDHNHGAYSGDEQSYPHTPPSKRSLISRGAVIIEDNVWFGDNVNVVGPLRVGYGAVIAANSVLRKDVPPLTIVAGAPAQVVKVYNEITEKWESKK
jgi:lipopolysaccharide O-acetyltransferase